MFFITVLIEAPVGTPLTYNFILCATDPLGYHGDAGLVWSVIPRRIDALTDVEIGEVRYEVAVQASYTDSAYVESRAPAGSHVISGLVFARGGGLVRIDYSDGESFVRAGPVRPAGG